MLGYFSGVSVRRVVDSACSQVPEHAHDWPVLSLFVLGGYSNETALGVAGIDGPSAIFYRARASHRNAIGPEGFEQIEIEFDPDWFGVDWIPDPPVSRWIGGSSGAEASSLARTCIAEKDEQRLRAAVRQFVKHAMDEPERLTPRWVAKIRRRLRNDTSLTIDALAREVGLHPSWVGSAYRNHIGQGLLETASWFRLERASRLLRETARAGVAIAQDAGFCDQSHMNRTFRRLLGRSPTEVREDRKREAQQAIHRPPISVSNTLAP